MLNLLFSITGEIFGKYWHPTLRKTIWEIAVKKDLMDSLGRQMLAVAAGWEEPVYRYYLPIHDEQPNFDE